MILRISASEADLNRAMDRHIANSRYNAVIKSADSDMTQIRLHAGMRRVCATIVPEDGAATLYVSCEGSILRRFVSIPLAKAVYAGIKQELRL
jgi:hypothetical protein